MKVRRTAWHNSLLRERWQEKENDRTRFRAREVGRYHRVGKRGLKKEGRKASKIGPRAVQRVGDRGT